MSSVEIVPFQDTITANGEYHKEAPEGQAYSPIDISVKVESPSLFPIPIYQFKLTDRTYFISDLEYTSEIRTVQVPSERVFVAFVFQNTNYWIRLYVNNTTSTQIVTLAAKALYLVDSFSASTPILYLVDSKLASIFSFGDQDSTDKEAPYIRLYKSYFSIPALDNLP